MKPSREPYGKCACAFTDGFSLSFPCKAGSHHDSDQVLYFDHDWFSHFAAQPREPDALMRYSVRRGDAYLPARSGR